MHLDKIFYTPFLSHKFPDNTELNKNLIDEIEQEKLLAPDGDTRSFASTPNNTWQSNTKMQHTYHSFRTLTRQIDDLLLEEEMKYQPVGLILYMELVDFLFHILITVKKTK